jgi:hypothetical protein
MLPPDATARIVYTMPPLAGLIGQCLHIVDIVYTIPPLVGLGESPTTSSGTL